MIHKLGIDVSKKKLDVALMRGENPDKFFSKTVINTVPGYEKLLQWSCQKADCRPEALHVILEATGPYHEKVALWLHQQGCQVSVVNPARIKHFAQAEGLRAKNDQLDAKLIALFGLKMQPLLWQPAPQEYQELQGLLHRLEALNTDLQREENRLEKMEASVSPSPIALESITRCLSFLQQEKQRLEKKIQNHIKQHPQLKEDQKLLQSIPGVGPVVASWMNALLQHTDHFQSARQVAAFVGLTPTEHSSGDTVAKKAKLSKAGPAVYRQKLYMAAIVAMQHNPDIKALYERLINHGKRPMEALGAAMRKLVHICFGVIKHQTPYQPQISQNLG